MVNRAAERVWRRRRDDLLGRVMWHEFPEAVGSPVYEQHLAAVREGHPRQLDTVSPVLNQRIRVTLFPLDGRLLVAFHGVADLASAPTGGTQAGATGGAGVPGGSVETVLRAAKDEAERAHEAKARLLKIASHDLRQPLHLLGLTVDHLAERLNDPAGRALCARVDQALLRIRRSLDYLAEAADYDSAQLAPRVESFPIQLLLERVIESCAPIAAAKGIRLRTVASRRVVESDQRMLGTIVLNLAGNAVKYTAIGGVVVGCRRSGDRLRIEVADTGPGIPVDQREAIFREFYRAAPARAEGLGLGLSITQRLAALLGHPVRLRSAVGKGSVFSVELPLADGARRPYGSGASD